MYDPTTLNPRRLVRANAPLVRCPGCGRCVIVAGDESAVTACVRCTTPLMTYRRRLDVEHSVRERLYGRRRWGVEVIPPGAGATREP